MRINFHTNTSQPLSPFLFLSFSFSLSLSCNNDACTNFKHAQRHCTYLAFNKSAQVVLNDVTSWRSTNRYTYTKRNDTPLSAIHTVVKIRSFNLENYQCPCLGWYTLNPRLSKLRLSKYSTIQTVCLCPCVCAYVNRRPLIIQTRLSKRFCSSDN